MKEEYYFVDFKDIKDLSDIHRAFKDGLKFKEYYGANLDALWDRLTDMMNYNAVITLKSFEVLEKYNKAYAEDITRLFTELKHYADDFFYDKIKIYFSRNGIISEIV